MEQSFWHSLPKPFVALATMAGVTDTVFRRIIARRAKPDVFWTEFVSCDGLVSRGREALLCDLVFDPIERPIVAQVFGATPKHFYETARLIVSLGFDGIDINMGCPDKAVVAQGAGAALIRTPALARDIILATKDGTRRNPAESGNSDGQVGSISVSVKTRTGYVKDEIDTWIPTLLDTGIAALTIHARTKKELSDVPARWSDVARVVEMARGTGTIIIGNGDVRDLEDANVKARESGADGVMMGRAIFGNPWLFDKHGKVPTVEEKLAVLVEHARLFEEVWGTTKPFDLLKKHVKAYVNGFRGASDLRATLMSADTANDIDKKVSRFFET